MYPTYLLIAVFVVWSARSVRSLWRSWHGTKLKFSIGDEICTAAFALAAWVIGWYLATKVVGWS